ncbi:hypothetical protein JOJ86_001470 [Rhodococcus percolatus]|nr:hypothetical protein [Rhodococcus opacus]MBP2203744.1 hypothetical protein [Rhodococcus opacus]
MARAAKALLDRGEHPGLWKIDDVRALWTRNRPGERELAERIKAAGGAIEDFPDSAAA